MATITHLAPGELQFGENLNPLMFRGKMCFNYHNDEKFAIFMNEDKGYVFDKAKELLYKLKDEAFINLLGSIYDIEESLNITKPSALKTIKLPIDESTTTASVCD